MGISTSSKIGLLTTWAILSTIATSPGLSTANNTSNFTKGVVAKERKGYMSPSEKHGPLPGIAASATVGRPGMGSEGGNSMGRRYWSTPDEVQILKVRGDSGQAVTLRESQESFRTNRQTLPILSWNHRSQGKAYPGFPLNRTAPELAGWGAQIPYEGVLGKESSFMYQVIGKGLANRSGITSRPFDAGLTRYEMWVKKAARKGGWRSDAWFFNSYNVVSQGGSVLGKLTISTPDSLAPSEPWARTFRDAPYLIDVVEDSGIMRAYSASVLTNSVSLVSQPKMLVLLSPDNSQVNRQEDKALREGSASIDRVLSSKLSPRTYKIDQAPGSPMPNDLGRQLAPNKNINDAGPTEGTAGEGSFSQNYKSTPLAKNWHYDAQNKKWHFKQWQRGEFLPDNQPHTWVLETKEDLLYAPQTSSSSVIDPNRITILDAQNTAVTDIPSTVIATGRVNAFDTGGFRLAINNDMRNSEWGSSRSFSGIEGIPDLAAINLTPEGYFYPDSRIVVALEHVLLKNEGGKTVRDGEWKTGKIHFWSSADQPGDRFTAKEVTFRPNGGSFDPYVDGWIFPVKDVSHTSAEYRLRVFMALPFQEVTAGQRLPSSFEDKIASPYQSNSFTNADMEKLLHANSVSPTRRAENDPLDHNEAYREALKQIGLSGVRGSHQNSVKRVSSDEVERVVSGVTFAGSGTALSSANIGAVVDPFGNNKTTWFEFTFPEANWTVQIPNVNVGTNPEEAGIIITE
jgi:hypothetical protein